MKTKSCKGSLLGSNSGISLWHYTRLSQPSQLTTDFSSGYGMIWKVAYFGCYSLRIYMKTANAHYGMIITVGVALPRWLLFFVFLG